MNPHQQQQQGQRQELPHESRTHDREVHVREDKTIVKTDVATTLTPEQTVQRYNQLAGQIVNTQKTIDAYKDKIEETLDEYNTEMAALHTMVDDHQQDDPDNIPSPEDAVDMLSNQDLQRYHQIQEMDTQIGDMHDNLQDGMNDLRELHKAARKMADRHNFELEHTLEEVEEKIGAGQD